MMLTISLIMYGSVNTDLELGVLKQLRDFNFEMKCKKWWMLASMLTKAIWWHI